MSHNMMGSVKAENMLFQVAGRGALKGLWRTCITQDSSIFARLEAVRAVGATKQ